MEGESGSPPVDSAPDGRGHSIKGLTSARFPILPFCALGRASEIWMPLVTSSHTRGTTIARCGGLGRCDSASLSPPTGTSDTVPAIWRCGSYGFSERPYRMNSLRPSGSQQASLRAMYRAMAVRKVPITTGLVALLSRVGRRQV